MKMRVNFDWDGCYSDLFLSIKDGRPTVLDCEYDRKALFEMCGGETTYCSNSGCTGSGYLDKLGELIPIGEYRTDTVYNDFIWFVTVANDIHKQPISVAVPFANHTQDKSELLRTYPTVIRFKDSVIYCDFEGNFLEILRNLMTGKGLEKNRGYRLLSKVFSKPDGWGDYCSHERTLEFYNLCSMESTLNPWEFYEGELKGYSTDRDKERIFQLLAVKESNGQFAKMFRLGSTWYTGEVLDGNPLEAGSLTAGWQRVADDIIARFYDNSNEVHLVAYTAYKEVHEKLARRFAYRLGEGEEFVNYVLSDNGNSQKYAEFEVVIPKALYVIDKAAQHAEVRKGLAKKVQRDVLYRVNQWIAKVNDQSILEAIPDDLIVTIEDSLDAGNCRPGTESFISQYFPGRTQATAGELKKHAGNFNVMRIFRYLAAMGRFSFKEKNPA